MQLYKLDADYRLADLIEDYDSLIWTERFRPAGDFELITPHVKKTRAALPLGSCLSLLDSFEVMIVETHDITTSEDGKTVLKVTGRTFESFFENRITLLNEDPISSATDETNAVIMKDQTAAIAAAQNLYYSTIDMLDNNNVIPKVIPSATGTVSGFPPADRFIGRNNTYAEVLKLLEEENLGIKCRRPVPGEDAIRIQIYLGEDKSKEIALDVSAGHFIGAIRYLWSIKGYKNAVHVASKNYFVKVFADGFGYSGTSHRTDLLDLSDITQIGDTVPDMLRAKGRAYLNEHRRTAYFEGSVSPNIPYKYNVDYGLGDKLLTRSEEYDITQTMQVVEYVRVEDEEGERGYPTLS